MIWILLAVALSACSPVDNLVKNQYRLGAFSGPSAVEKGPHSILITPPEAVAGYQTNQMLYIQKPFILSAYRDNSWVSPPADMLFPLLVQSIEQSHHFRAVVSGNTDVQTDYRLDSQLLELDQSFLVCPSIVTLTVKVVLSQVSENNRVIASRIFSRRVKCPADNPYGGVIAANRASKEITSEVSRFVVAYTSPGP